MVITFPIDSEDFMATSVFSTIDIRSSNVLLIAEGDNLLVTAGSSIYWTDGSTLGFSDNPFVSSSSRIDIFGTVFVDNFDIGSSGRVTIGAQGSISVLNGLVIGGGVSGSYSTLLNNGEILSLALSASGIKVTGAQNTVVNNGTISGYVGVYLGADYLPGNLLENTGLISASQTGVLMQGDNTIVHNTGRISAGLTGIYASDIANGAGVPAVSNSISNSGQIDSAYYGVNIFGNLTGFVMVIVNTGTITGAAYSIFSSEATDLITNTGILNGNVDLGDGNDVFNSLGGKVNGTVAGGTGADTYFTSDPTLIILENSGDTAKDTVNAATTFRLGANIENLTLLGTASFNGFGNVSANTILGNSGDNRLVGLDGNDTITGDLGDDRLVGGNGLDSLDGGDGDDVLVGNLGNDTLRGSDGDDRITSGGGFDFMTGGNGADTFIFAALSHSGATTASADVIGDFVRGDDRIDVALLDAISTNTVSNDTFTFIGAAALTTVAGQLHYVQSGGNTFVEMEVNGILGADIIIRLNGLFALSAADFVL